MLLKARVFQLITLIFVGDNTTFLDHEHQFMRSMHVMDSRSQTRASSHCYLHTREQLILFSEILNQLHNWILRELVL